MKRSELLKTWCAAEGGKKSALDAPQAKEAYAKLRRIIGEEIGIDLDDVIERRCLTIDVSAMYDKHDFYDAFPVYPWRNGKPVKK